ncbi:MAG: Holliday junction branch migration protein RuvA [Desulfobacteria bacterium]
MIAQIHGILVHKSLDHLIVDVNGVGYKVHIPLSTFYQLPEIDSTVKLNTYTHVREDLLQLYGFFTRQERDIFQLLIGVSGIGPRLAINILSGIPVWDLCKALSEGNVSRLSAAPGVGKKTAERMVLELRDKIGTIPFSEKPPIAGETDRGEVERDVISALINLGYKKAVAENALEMAKNTLKTDTSVLEDLLKEALRVLSKS